MPQHQEHDTDYDQLRLYMKLNGVCVCLYMNIHPHTCGLIRTDCLVHTSAVISHAAHQTSSWTLDSQSHTYWKQMAQGDPLWCWHSMETRFQSWQITWQLLEMPSQFPWSAALVAMVMIPVHGSVHVQYDPTKICYLLDATTPLLYANYAKLTIYCTHSCRRFSLFFFDL